MSEVYVCDKRKCRQIDLIKIDIDRLQLQKICRRRKYRLCAFYFEKKAIEDNSYFEMADLESASSDQNR